jgi:methyltransferase (TIGR00027 family)
MNSASITAMMTAYCRWHHFEYDTPLIFADHLAGDILGEEGKTRIESLLLAALERGNPVSAATFATRREALAWMMQTGASSPIVLARARCAEEQLEAAVTAGCRHYVILGAGLDTFAFRRPDLLAILSVYEIDHPASQAYKLLRIRELGGDAPANLHFIPLDFTRQSLPDVLARSGFNPQAPVFFSWLGVSYYLDAGDVRATLRQIAASAPSGSLLLFDYLDSVACQPAKVTPRVARMLSSVRELGEPMLSCFDAHELAHELAECGFTLREHLGPCDIHRRYFMGRTDYHRACEHVHFALAEVA